MSERQTRLRSGIRNIVRIVVIGLVIVAGSCAFLMHLVGGLSFPSTERIGQRYLDTVVAEDVEAAVALAQQETRCRQSLEDDALRDMAELSRAEIRNLIVETRYNSGSDDEMQFADMEFEYRKASETEWKQARLSVHTDYAPLRSLRYSCGVNSSIKKRY